MLGGDGEKKKGKKDTRGGKNEREKKNALCFPKTQKAIGKITFFLESKLRIQQQQHSILFHSKTFKKKLYRSTSRREREKERKGKREREREKIKNKSLRARVGAGFGKGKSPLGSPWLRTRDPSVRPRCFLLESLFGRSGARVARSHECALCNKNKTK